MTALHKIFIDELKGSYEAEYQIVKALPKMIDAVEHEELKGALESHLEEAGGHIERLEKLFGAFDRSSGSEKYQVPEGFPTEGWDLNQSDGDQALVTAAQNLRQLRMAAYGSLTAWARLLGEDKALYILEEMLNGKKSADDPVEMAENQFYPTGGGNDTSTYLSAGRN